MAQDYAADAPVQVSTPKSVINGTKMSIEETRAKVVENRKQQLRSTWETRAALLYEMFYLSQTSQDPSIIERSTLEPLLAAQFPSYLAERPLPIKPPSDLHLPGLPASVADVSELKRASSVLASPNAERMVTRGVSGAIRPKHIDEILGNEKSASSPRHERANSKTPVAAGLAHSKERNRTPEGKHFKRRHKFDHLDLYKWQLEGQAQPIYSSLRTAHKVVTTRDWKLAREELIAIKALQRLDSLRMSDSEPYSFRQPEKQRPHTRPKAHWDHLLDELKWMQADFKEERRWKIVSSKLLAAWVMEWHSAEDKSTLCVNRRQRTEGDEAMDVLEPPVDKLMDEQPAKAASVADSTEDTSKVQEDITMLDAPPTELANAAESSLPSDAVDANTSNGNNPVVEGDSIVVAVKQPSEQELAKAKLIEDCRLQLLETDLMQTIFTTELLLQMSDASLALLDIFADLPSYEIDPTPNAPYVDEIDDLKLAPASEYMSRNIVIKSAEAPRKRRRLGGLSDDDEDDADGEILQVPRTRFDPSENKDAMSALFMPKRTRDGLLSMRPPPIPPNVANRPMMHWTSDEDDLLMRLIKQCQFNWEMIADVFNTSRAASKIAEPRTAWDCYEHWVKKDSGSSTALQGIAGQHHQQAFAAVQALAAQHTTLKLDPKKGSIMGTVTPVKFRSEAHRKKQRSASMFDAMKKTARKREAAARQNPPATQPASARKAQDSPSATSRVPTPADLSKQKAERDRALAQQILEQRQQAAAAYALQGNRPMLNRMPASAVAAAAAAAAAAAGQLPANHPLAQQNRQGASNPAVSAAAAAAAAAAGLTRNAAGINANSPRGAARPMLGGAGVPNAAAVTAALANANAGNNTVGVAGSPRLPAGLTREQMQALLTARQNQLRQQAAAGQLPNASNAAVLQNYANALATITAANNVNGVTSSDGSSPNPQASAASPTSGTTNNAAAVSASAALSAALTPTITALSNQIALQNPNFTPQQVATMAQARFQQLYAAQLRVHQMQALQQQQQQAQQRQQK